MENPDKEAICTHHKAARDEEKQTLTCSECGAVSAYKDIGYGRTQPAGGWRKPEQEAEE